jgi:hypothetical protein
MPAPSHVAVPAQDHCRVRRQRLAALSFVNCRDLRSSARSDVFRSVCPDVGACLQAILSLAPRRAARSPASRLLHESSHLERELASRRQLHPGARGKDVTRSDVARSAGGSRRRDRLEPSGRLARRVPLDSRWQKPGNPAATCGIGASDVAPAGSGVVCPRVTYNPKTTKPDPFHLL